MKAVFITLLFLITICLFACKKENEINYKVTKAISLEESIHPPNGIVSRTSGNYVMQCQDGFTGCGGISGIACSPTQAPCTAGHGTYVKACPDGSVGCGASSGILCSPSQTPCTANPKPIIRQYICAGSNLLGCKAGLQTGITCPTAITCAGENHSAPCNFGSIAFGCFSGSPISGPSCGPLVNCQTPPD
jgi:hypothetical protein